MNLNTKRMIEMLQFRTNETKLKYSNKKASKSKKRNNIIFYLKRKTLQLTEKYKNSDEGLHGVSWCLFDRYSCKD